MKTKIFSENAADEIAAEEEANAGWDEIGGGLQSSNEALAPEVPPGAENLTAWDEVPSDPDASGAGAESEDEAMTSERLVEEGIEEADRELRLNAADESDDGDPADDEEAGADYPVSGILS